MLLNKIRWLLLKGKRSLYKYLLIQIQTGEVTGFNTPAGVAIFMEDNDWIYYRLYIAIGDLPSNGRALIERLKEI